VQITRVKRQIWICCDRKMMAF